VSALLRVEGLAKHYGELEALDDVSFELGAGELVAVVGPNGAGKTTLLSIIAGAQAPSAGSVSPQTSRIGWVPQQSALYSKLTVAENLQLFARLERVDDVQRAVARMLAQTGLQERADELVARLSGGNRQRLHVALGLIADPPVLALDEPSAALDPSQRGRLWDFVCGLVAGGTAVLFSTHNVSEAQRYAARVLVLAAGRLIFDGTPAALRTAGERAGDGVGAVHGVGEREDLERALVRFLEQHEGTAAAPREARA
jgi:ABC-2 type transport system ATP-binding protein